MLIIESVFKNTLFITLQMLKELEPEVTEFYTQSKGWQEFYVKELSLWSKLHHSVQRHIMAEFQLNVGLIPPVEGGTG